MPFSTTQTINKYHPSDYKPLAKIGNYSVTANVWATAVSVTGKGFLTKGIVFSNTAALAKIRITVDGTLVNLTNANATSSISGILQTNQVYTDPTTAVVRALRPVTTNLELLANGTRLGYPETGDTPGYVLIDNPIYFQNSLLVEIMATATTAIQYDVSGGVN